jgi:hypothetical protein
MRIVASLMIVGLFSLATVLRAECTCPPESRSKHLLITTSENNAKGFVACGYEDGRSGNSVRGSEFQVFRCGIPGAVLEFDALETADLNAVTGNLHVVRVSNWPFGKRWTWQYVPVAETTLTQDDIAVEWKRLLPTPTVTRSEVRRFLRIYVATVKKRGRSYAPDEEVVARLFAAMATGNRTALQLFRAMPRDVTLDGAAGEIYEIALAEFQLGRPPN